MTAPSGVYPCYENQFQIKTASNTWSTIADCETFEVAFDNGVEEWTPFDHKGWTRRLLTSKSVTLTVTAKRNVGDTGNDCIAGLAFVNGRAAEKDFKWTFPDGTYVEFPGAVISVTNLGGGDASNVAALEFEVQSNGKPTGTVAGVTGATGA